MQKKKKKKQENQLLKKVTVTMYGSPLTLTLVLVYVLKYT